MSPRDLRRPGARPDPSDDDGPDDDRPDDPVQALTDFLAAVVEAPPGSEDEPGQSGDGDGRGE